MLSDRCRQCTYEEVTHGVLTCRVYKHASLFICIVWHKLSYPSLIGVIQRHTLSSSGNLQTSTDPLELGQSGHILSAMSMLARYAAHRQQYDMVLWSICDRSKMQAHQCQVAHWSACIFDRPHVFNHAVS